MNHKAGRAFCGGWSRRRWLAASAAGLWAALRCRGQSPWAFGFQKAISPSQHSGPLWQLPLGEFPVLGTIRTRSAAEIEASRLSVGFEVLDRQLFDPERTYPYLAQLGVKWARCQTGWCRCERSPGEYNFAWLDEVVNKLLALGIRPWFCLSYGNRLYMPAADEAAVGWAPVYSQQAAAAWVRFTAAIARHFADRVQHWEIWNEPNISQFWKPGKPDPADYVRLVAMTAPVIRREIPQALIVGGAFAGMPVDFLRGCLKSGLADFVDKISFHPYRPVPEAGYAAEVATFRSILATTGKEIRLWQGENGCPSRGGPESTGALANLEWDETRQAKWLLRRMLFDLWLDLELTSYFHVVDLVGYRGKTNFKGLLRGHDYSPKPAYFAFRNLCSLFDARTLPVAGEEISLQVRVPDIDRHATTFNAKDQETSEHLAREAIVATFCRDGRTTVAFWYPANLQKPWTPLSVDLVVPGGKSAGIEEPVLVDLLSGKVHAVACATRATDELRLENLSLVDYPLLVTDRASVPS